MQGNRINLSIMSSHNSTYREQIRAAGERLMTLYDEHLAKHPHLTPYSGISVKGLGDFKVQSLATSPENARIKECLEPAHSLQTHSSSSAPQEAGYQIDTAVLFNEYAQRVEAQRRQHDLFTHANTHLDGSNGGGQDPWGEQAPGNYRFEARQSEKPVEGKTSRPANRSVGFGSYQATASLAQENNPLSKFKKDDFPVLSAPKSGNFSNKRLYSKGRRKKSIFTRAEHDKSVAKSDWDEEFCCYDVCCRRLFTTANLRDGHMNSTHGDIYCCLCISMNLVAVAGFGKHIKENHVCPDCGLEIHESRMANHKGRFMCHKCGNIDSCQTMMIRHYRSACHQ